MKHLICLLIVVVACGAEATDWKAGVATAVLTPDRPMPMSGYAARKKTAEGKDQDLFGKALVIEDAQGSRVVFITLDLIGVIAELRSAVESRLETEFNLPAHALVMNASHALRTGIRKAGIERLL